MDEELAFEIAGISVGFMAAICFCIGSVMTSAHDMATLSKTHGASVSRMAHSLAVQRGLYAAGALLLLISCGLQVWGILLSSTNPVDLPPVPLTWSDLLLVVPAGAGLIAFLIARWIYKRTLEKTLRIVDSP